MKKDKLMKIFCTALVLSFILVTQAFGARKTLYLEAGVWNPQYSTKTTTADYYTAACYSVYPPGGGKDTYTKIRVKAWAGSTGGDISDTITLKESDSYLTNIYFTRPISKGQGYTIGFRGNDATLPAYADVYYNHR